jgi:hypothetical protein
MRDGASAEIAMVDNEGLIGVALFMGERPRVARSCEVAAALTCYASSLRDRRREAPASNLARRPSCRTRLVYVGGSTGK